MLPTNITAGRNLEAGDSGVVLLSENNSAYFSAGVGDTLTILDQTFTVVGIHGSSGVSDQTTLYMNLSDAQAVTNNTGYITSLRVFAQSSDVVTQVASDISSLHSELTVTTGQERLSELTALQSGYDTALQNAQDSIGQTQATAVEEIIVVVAATSLIVLFVMLYTVRERTKEIGTLKAIGFSNFTVMGQFMPRRRPTKSNRRSSRHRNSRRSRTHSLVPPATKHKPVWKHRRRRPKDWRTNNRRRIRECGACAAGVRCSPVAWLIGQPVPRMESSKDQTSRGDEV